MTIIDWIFCYIIVTGLIAYLITHPKIAKLYHKLWCKKHQLDEDYEEQRLRRAADLCTIEQDRLAISALAFLLGWTLIPLGLILSVFKVRI